MNEGEGILIFILNIWINYFLQFSVIDYKHQSKTNSYRPPCFYYPNAVIYVLTAEVLQAWVLHCRHCRYNCTKQKVILFFTKHVHYIIVIVSMILLWQSGRCLQSVINLIGVVLMCNISLHILVYLVFFYASWVFGCNLLAAWNEKTVFDDLILSQPNSLV